MSCPYCGKDDIYTREVTYKEEEFDHYDEDGNAVYHYVWTSYDQNTCDDCKETWESNHRSWTSN